MEFLLRLQYAATALLVGFLAGCGPMPISRQQAIDVALSHAPGAAVVQANEGTIGELAPAGLQYDDPGRRVWAVTLNGTFLADCDVGPAGELDCPPEPKLGLIVLDYVTGDVIGWSIITHIR